MENQQQTTTLCRAGCGFYGSPATEGLCSKCFKDQIKRKQDTVRHSPTAAIQPMPNTTAASNSASNNSGSSTSTSTSASNNNNSNSNTGNTTDVTAPTTSAVAIADKVREVVSCSQAAKSSEDVTAQLESAVAAAASALETAVGGASSSGVLSNSSSVASLEGAADSNGAVTDAPPPAKKPNRCQVCKKRVGLTGFVCRCGGLYCGEHRYDSAHGCSFDYKTMEREELRKNNPVIVSEKIQRI